MALQSEYKSALFGLNAPSLVIPTTKRRCDITWASAWHVSNAMGGRDVRDMVLALHASLKDYLTLDVCSILILIKFAARTGHARKFGRDQAFCPGTLGEMAGRPNFWANPLCASTCFSFAAATATSSCDHWQQHSVSWRKYTTTLNAYHWQGL